jgi:rSAM/selenodomain-associated transferase 1
LVCYDNEIEENDVFNSSYFLKEIQRGADLGERMSEAFSAAFHAGFSRVICIGSDCLELSANLITDAFKALGSSDVVLGPAVDGGYYLVGMKKLYTPVFKDKEWSTPNVLLDTLLSVKQLGLTYHLLPTLNDIDTMQDLTPELLEILEGD